MRNPCLTDFIAPLIEHRDRLADISIGGLFEKDMSRVDTFSVRLKDLLFDFSKNRIDGAALEALLGVAKSLHVEQQRDAMFAGDKINRSENRAVLHTALRNRIDEPVRVDGVDVMPDVRGELNRALDFADELRAGRFTASGNRIENVVNIGIGGSDLGPRMAVVALRPYGDGPQVRFVANVDSADLADILRQINPATTLFIIASKSFTTKETMTNAKSAFDWVKAAMGESAAEHFVALSTNLKATAGFGIPLERTFGFWDWVGGRYSVWSAIGLPLMIAIGREKFGEFLDGAFIADQHFRDAPLGKNIPVIMALLGLWHRNVCGYTNQAIFPYDSRMANFPRWMQQLDMESNGKSIRQDGSPVMLDTGPIIFGEPGTNGQHAFFQLLHQGTEIVPCDFLVAANGHEADLEHHHRQLVANCLAQSEALMRGRTSQEAGGNPHRAFEGNRPSNTFLYNRLDPQTLGTLMALYEHKVFVLGVLWGINSFDQWGVELGKELAGPIENAIASRDVAGIENPSTKSLLKEVWKLRGQ